MIYCSWVMSTIYAFRGRRGGLIKVLWHDGVGMCLFIKRLERGSSSGRYVIFGELLKRLHLPGLTEHRFASFTLLAFVRNGPTDKIAPIADGQRQGYELDHSRTTIAVLSLASSGGRGCMDVGNVQIGNKQIARFRLASMRDLDELESGVYWPRLQPYFLRPQFRRLRYRINERGLRPQSQNGAAATRGASGLGELDVAYVRDRPAASMVITETGLPDYCLTAVTRGSLECSGTQKTGMFEVTVSHGLVYRGLPGTTLSAAQGHERIAIWIPAASLQQRLLALLGGPVTEDIIFEPVFEWANASMQSLRRRLWLLTAELGSENSFVSNEIACRS